MYGDRYEFRDGAPTADGVPLLDELAMMLYDTMDFASEAGSLQGLSTADTWELLCGGEACVVVVSCGGYRSTTNATNQRFDWKATRTSNTTCTMYTVVLLTYLSVLSAFLNFGADGAA